MTLVSKIHVYEDFIQNVKKNKGKNIFWKGKNLNTSEIVNFLSELVKKNICLREFYKRLNIQCSKAIEHIFLFKLTLAARFNLNFYDYCQIVNNFASWNSLCKKIYHSAEFFKKMILHRNIGENYPIRTPEELMHKLNLFNKIAGFIVLTYFDILDSASKDLINGKITSKQYVNIIYLILKAADKKFEKEICRRGLNALKEGNNMERVNLFQDILNNNHKY